jgi:hypothetical protein
MITQGLISLFSLSKVCGELIETKQVGFKDFLLTP